VSASEPLVSVVITTWNRADLISRAIESVLAQTVKDVQIIVADDGSTDGTARVVESFGEAVEYVVIPHSGFACAPRNAGLERARGRYVSFVDSDDLWYPTKLEKQIEVFDMHPELVMVYCDHDFVDANGEKIEGRSGPRPAKLEDGAIVETDDYWEDAFSQLVLSCFIASHTPLTRREVFGRIGGFDESLRFCEDRDMWLRVALEGPVARVSEVLASVRLHEGNWSRDNSELWVENQIRVYDKLAVALRGDPGRRAFLAAARRATRPRLASTLVTVAYETPGLTYLRRARIIARALRLDPGLMKREPHTWKNALKMAVRGIACVSRRAGPSTAAQRTLHIQQEGESNALTKEQ